jgi:hypothetical protein
MGDCNPNMLIGSITGRRDLVDFFPVYLAVGSVLKAATNITIILKQADAALFFIETRLTPSNYMNYLRDTNFFSSLPYHSPATLRIGPGGYGLSQDFYNDIMTNNGGIILVEACKPTKAPLVMELWQGTNLLASTSLCLSIDTVETMFRHKNLVSEVFPKLNSLGAPADRLTDASVPNEPDTNEKNFVFLHGYNVNPGQARGVFSDTFKRMYWSGSHAKFYGVSWNGYETQNGVSILPNVTCNFHTNVVNALLTAPKLADLLGTLTNGQTVVAAHSLGNMAVLSSISDWNAPISSHFMIDAAVPIEAIQTNAIPFSGLYYSDWLCYADRLNSHEWHNLFPTNDGRNALTWIGRVSNLRNTDVYNFYSSGEEVLRATTSDPPSELLSAIQLQVYGYIASHTPLAAYAWVYGEKAKGRADSDAFLGTTHGGWLFDYWSPVLRYTNGNGVITLMPPSQATLLPDSLLRTNSFFCLNSAHDPQPIPHPDAALLGANGSQYAQTYRDRILSEAIPSLTLPVGANRVDRFAPDGEPDRNFDMQQQFQNGWPSGRPPRQVGFAGAGEWHHSDFREVAYTFTYKLFKEIVNDGNLK